MTRTSLFLTVALLLGGCAGQTRSAASAEQEGLVRELAGRTAGEAQSCIPVRDSESLTVVDSRTVVRRSGRTTWVNRLDGECPGLRPLVTVIAEIHGSQYCRGDRVRGLDPGTTIPGPHCPLGDWVPYRAPR